MNVANPKKKTSVSKRWFPSSTPSQNQASMQLFHFWRPGPLVNHHLEALNMPHVLHRARYSLPEARHPQNMAAKRSQAEYRSWDPCVFQCVLLQRLGPCNWVKLHTWCDEAGPRKTFLEHEDDGIWISRRSIVKSCVRKTTTTTRSMYSYPVYINILDEILKHIKYKHICITYMKHCKSWCGQLPCLD